jgi:hypothetical protein
MERRWQASAYAVAVVGGALTSLFLLRIPIQLSDSFTEFLVMQNRSLREVISNEFSGGPYFRPLRRGLIKILFDLSGGHYSAWFRGFHALELIALFVLVVRMFRVRSLAGATAVPLLLTMIIGLHTFNDVVREAFPVNHFLTIAICCVAAVNLAQSRGGVLVDLCAVALLAFAMLTIESGLLVWVVFVAAYIAGYRGISRPALAALTATFAFYFFLRFVVLGGTIPAINERETGFALGAANPDELKRLFGANLWPFYIYNVLSAISCVLFAEPRSGTWIFVRGALNHDLAPWQILGVVTSTLTTLLIARYVALHSRKYRRLDVNDDDRLVMLFLVLLPANAAFAAVYAKDVILSPAGIFYAIAAAVVLKQLLFQEIASRHKVIRATAFAVTLVVACGWTIRAVGIHYRLRETAAVARDDWAYYDRWERRQDTDHVTTPSEKRMWQILYDDAIWNRLPPPMIDSRVANAWSDPLE